MRIFAAILLLSLITSISGHAYTSAGNVLQTDGSVADTQAAINAAPDGATVQLPAGGSFVWATQLTVSGKSLTIQGGSPTNRPTISATSTGGFAITISVPTGGRVTVKDLRFNGWVNGNGLIYVDGSGEDVYRFTNIEFNSAGQWCMWISSPGSGQTGEGPYGLIDNCTWPVAASGSGIFIRDNPNANPKSWRRNMSWGTKKAVYIEDCTFSAGQMIPGRGAVDCDNGARVVFRRNTLRNFTVATHGADSSGPTNSVLQFELLHNTWTLDNASNGQDFAFFLRGGTAVVHDNTLNRVGNDFYNSLCKMNYYRATPGNGVAAVDRFYPQDYLGTQQPCSGVLVGAPSQDPHFPSEPWVSMPVYTWGNTLNAPVYYGEVSSNSQFMQLNKDFFIGTPKPGYAEYTYPHPLRGTGSAPGAPAITGYPQSQTCMVGQPATFSVVATGTAPLSYQWQKGSTNIAGATAATYSIASVTTGDSGNYRCVVSNGSGSATSMEAALMVNPTPTAPAITAGPQALTRAIGESAALTVVATGTAPLSYQWQKNQASIAGATTATYTIPSVTSTDSGNYRCVVSNGSGSATSAEAALTIDTTPVAPTITTNPQALTVVASQSATFGVTATGTGPLAYQWQKNQVNIAGATAASYTIASVVAGDAGNYRCVVSNSSGSSTSSTAALTVSPAALAGIYYVDESAGNDGNPGSAAGPWRRCPGMVGWTGSATLQPGDIVYFNRAGTWNIGQNPSGPGLDLKRGVHYIGNQWNPGGGESRRAILRATARHETGVVRFWEDHTSLPTWFQGFEINANDQRTNLIDINHSFWRSGLTNAVKRVEDCVAHGNTGNGSEGDYKYGIIISDGSPDASGQVANVEILNTIVFDVARDGICLYPGSTGMISNILVRGCEVYNTDRDPSYAGGHGLLVKGNVKNSVIEYCYSHDVNSSAVFINGPEYGSGPGPSNCVVRHNILQTVDDNGVIRIYGAGVKSLDIVGNIVLPNETTGGLSFAGNSGVIGARVYNNTFYNSFVDIGNPNSTGTIEFQNNIIYELDDVPLTDSGGKLTNHSNNLLFRAGGGTLVRVGSANYSSASIGNWEPTARTSDPLFKNAAGVPNGFAGVYGSSLAPNNDGLSLRTGSPALNAGADGGANYNGSINSRLRPVDGTWDIGAYEGLGSGLRSAPKGLRVVAQ